MELVRLKMYLPVAAPARRVPCDGSESPFRVCVGFEPKWFTERCGVRFTERWHRDPVLRFYTLRRMKAELIERFPEARQWDEGDPSDTATISGCYGAYLIPHACGLPLRFAPDRYPVLENAPKLTNPDQIKVNEILTGPVVEHLLRQIEIIHRRWGPAAGYLNWQGVLNNAFHLRGHRIFLDLYDDPARAQAFFEKITDLMIAMARLLQGAQRKTGFMVDHMSVSNCVMNMIAPGDYERFLLQYDARIARSFRAFGVHTCNWNVTPYLEALRKLPKLGYLDMGISSDLARVRDVFPDLRRALIYSPVWLQEKSPEELKTDLERIRRELAPCDVVMADISWTTPDERVSLFISLCREQERLLTASENG